MYLTSFILADTAVGWSLRSASDKDGMCCGDIPRAGDVVLGAVDVVPRAIDVVTGAVDVVPRAGGGRPRARGETNRQNDDNGIPVVVPYPVAPVLVLQRTSLDH